MIYQSDKQKKENLKYRNDRAIPNFLSTFIK